MKEGNNLEFNSAPSGLTIENMEKELYKALALVLLEDRVDQWGNKIGSPLAAAIDKWANDNHSNIAEAIVKNLTIDGLAERVANRIIDQLSGSVLEANKGRETLRTVVNEKLAEMLAKRQLEELDKKNPLTL